MLHMRLLSPPSDPKAWMMIQPRGQQRWATFSALAMIIMMTTTTTTLLTRAEDLVEEKHTAYVTGDIILGGLFPMHEHNITKKEKPCGAIKEEKGIQRMEAMLYALDQINKDRHLLPDISLGALILDTCSNPSYALEQSMLFVRSFIGDEMNPQCSSGKAEKAQPVAGVIGAAFSGVSIMVANILRLFKIPQISYASTSTELSDKSRFEYFSRVVPPDNFQAQAMVEIAKVMGWTYVSTVAAQGEYGEKGIASFIALAKKEGICVAINLKINRNSQRDDFDQIVDQLSSKPKARAVVLFVDEDRTRKLLSATVRRGKTGFFYWIGSDSWGAKIHPVRHQEWAAEGAITILPKRSSLTGFDNYFLNLKPPMRLGDCEDPYIGMRNPSINCRNPWFREFWSHHFNCRFEDQPLSEMPSSPIGLKLCTGKEKVTKYEQEGLVPFVVDAMYAMAHALHNMVVDRCGEFHFGSIAKANRANHKGIRHGGGGHSRGGSESSSKGDQQTVGPLCEELSPSPAGGDLLQYIRSVSFISAQGDEIGDVKFNGDGDRIGRYSIFQYQKVPDEGYKYIQVGEFGEFPDWTYKHKISRAHQVGMTQQLALNTFIMQWPNVSEMGTPPLSVCSHSCRMGHIKSFTDACCWTCVPCRDDSIVVDEDSCYQCPLGYVPNDEKNQCLRLDAEALEGQSPWVFFPLVFSSVGMVMTLEVVAVFIYYNRTSIIMASGRELSYVLLGGIFFSYACPFVILSEPGAITCSMIRLGLGLCLCVCYSAIFTKTNRIYRIFHGCMKGNQKPAYISPKSQLVICSGLISVQLLGVSIWLAIEPPSVRVFHPSREVAVLTCGTSNFSLAISLGYNMALIFLCTWYAIKTRKVPENFNEAKYIGFTMYATCIIWLSFIPIFFGTKNDFEIQISSMCMCVILSATVTLFCLFMPKIYIVMLHPEKCARSLPGGGKSGAGSGGATGGPTSVGKNKMRFTKSQDSSISNISDTFNARTPQTPLTPLTPKTPSSHHPSTNSNHQNHNKEDVVQIETRKNSTLNPVSITTTEIHVSFSEPNDIHEIPRYDDEETSTSHQENSLTNGHTDSPPLPPIPFAQPPPPSMVTSMAVTSNIKTNPAFDDKMSLVNEVKETQQYGEAEDYYDSEDDDWSGS